jgi:MYXO-CTERM domain-containing protein
MTRRHIATLMGAAAIGLVMAGPSAATSFTVHGTVLKVGDSAPGSNGLVIEGETVTFSFEIDETVADASAPPSTGIYPGALTSLNVTFQRGATFVFGPGDMTTHNDVDSGFTGGPGDPATAKADVLWFFPESAVSNPFGDAFSQVLMNFRQETLNPTIPGLLTSDALPPSPLDFSAGPAEADFQVFVEPVGEFHPELDLIVLIPEPTTASLAGLGLLALGAIGRRRRN